MSSKAEKKIGVYAADTAYVDFINRLMHPNPAHRMSAKEALGHPFMQQRLLDAWLGDRDDLCVVGDANQTIYSFAGATPSHLLDFPKRFPGAVVIRLHRDYRSTPQIVELANNLVGQTPGRFITMHGVVIPRQASHGAARHDEHC